MFLYFKIISYNLANICFRQQKHFEFIYEKKSSLIIFWANLSDESGRYPKSDFVEFESSLKGKFNKGFSSFFVTSLFGGSSKSDMVWQGGGGPKNALT